jgi:hypothetical protein
VTRAVVIAAACAAVAALVIAVQAPAQRESAKPLADQRPLLVVHQRLGRSDAHPIEGSLSYIRVEGAGIVHYSATFSHPSFDITYPLKIPGRVTLASYQRGCNGNCGSLAPPSERCSRSVRVAKDERVTARITVVYGHPCRIAIARG